MTCSWISSWGYELMDPENHNGHIQKQVLGFDDSTFEGRVLP